MAPPQVDLSKKQPLEDVQGWAEKVGEQKLPPLPPLAPSAPVAVETGTTVGGRRVLAKRRCKKLIIGIVIGAVIATAITVGAFMAHRRHRHHDEWKGRVKDSRGHDSEEHVRTEGSRHLIHIARNATNHFFGLRAVLDYETRLAGFKDCSREMCYVDRLRESYEEGCSRWRYYNRHARLPSERPLVVGPEIDSRVLEYIGGEDIFGLCSHLPTFWVLEMEEGAPRDNATRIIYL